MKFTEEKLEQAHMGELIGKSKKNIYKTYLKKKNWWKNQLSGISGQLRQIVKAMMLNIII